MRHSYWKVLMVLATIGLLGVPGWATSQEGTAQAGNQWGFDGQKAGAAPSGWKGVETGAKAKPAKWEIIADSTAPSVPNVVAVTKTENTGDTINFLLAEGQQGKDLSLEVKVRVISGKNNQGSGLVWRVQDSNNYYLARWTPLSNNFRVYCVKDGKPRRLANLNIKVDRKAWHTIRVSHQGDRIKASLDDQKPLEITDATFTKAGMIGLCTKADAMAAFDDLQVRGTRASDTDTAKRGSNTQIAGYQPYVGDGQSHV